MVELSTISILVALFLLFASIIDLCVSRIPKPLTGLGVALGLLINITRAIQTNNLNMFIACILGLLLGCLIAWASYKVNLWGGGDAALMIALGTMLGLSFQLVNFTMILFLTIGIWQTLASILRRAGLPIPLEVPTAPCFLIAYLLVL